MRFREAKDIGPRRLAQVIDSLRMNLYRDIHGAIKPSTRHECRGTLTNSPATSIPVRAFFICAALASFTKATAQQHFNRSEDVLAYQSRADVLIKHFAQLTPANDFTRGGYIEIAARLRRNEDLPWALARLDSLIAQPSGDVFWMHHVLNVIYLGRGQLPRSYQQRLRELWRTYHPYRGDTENHWTLYYTALYLITQSYPNEPGASWFNGRSSQENFSEAREYLVHWMKLTTTMGQGEYDSPDYVGMFVAPMAQLYAWAEDTEMKRRALLMLEWLLADFAAESLNGLYVGAHSRTYPRPVKEQWRVGSTGLAWLLWNNTPFYPTSEAATLAMSGYQPAEIVYRMGLDRAQPYIHRERKRTRDRMRFSAEKNAPVYKYTYMRKEYALGSSQGGLLQPIQQHTWDLTWAVDDPRGARNTFFMIQPHSSSRELGMYFAEPLGPVTELVVRSKTTYDSGEKWTGGSPFEQVFQHEDALITLCDIPPGARFPHFMGYFSKDLARREEEESGWIFAQGGEALLACYPLAGYEWQQDEDGDMRLFSPHLKNGAVVQIAPASEYSWEKFKQAVRVLALEKSMEPKPRVRFTSLRGARMEFVYDETPRVNGVALDYEHWPQFEGPFMFSKTGSRKLMLRHGKLRRVWDFEKVAQTASLQTKSFAAAHEGRFAHERFCSSKPLTKSFGVEVRSRGVFHLAPPRRLRDEIKACPRCLR